MTWQVVEDLDARARIAEAEARKAEAEAAISRGRVLAETHANVMKWLAAKGPYAHPAVVAHWQGQLDRLAKGMAEAMAGEVR